jgi:6-phosphogluconate dehydrogenase
VVSLLTRPDYDSLCKSLSTPRLIVFSLPHGGVGDKVVEGLMPHLSRDDIILDCGNEHFANTDRRRSKTLVFDTLAVELAVVTRLLELGHRCVPAVTSLR